MSGPNSLSGKYSDTNDTVQTAATNSIRYIVEGWGQAPSVNVKGLCVYGIIGALRENNDVFYGSPGLDEEQRSRLDEVELIIEGAVQRKLQFYPFGHDTDRYVIDYSGDRDDRQRALTARSGPFRAAKSGTGARKGKKLHYGRDGRISSGETKPIPVLDVVVRRASED